MKIKSIITVLLLSFISFTTSISNNNYLGSQTLYVKEDFKYTNPPEGYKPFFINHLGRHGARYLSSSKGINKLEQKLLNAQKNNQLTISGIELLEKIQAIIEKETNNYGLLSEVGKNMEKEIGKRMFNNFEYIFENRKVFAVATYVKRTQQSMDEFLISFYDKLNSNQIDKSINGKIDPILRFFDLNTEYLSYKEDGKWKSYLKNYEKRSDIYTSITEKIFKKDYPLTLKEKFDFTTTLYSIYTNQFDIDFNVELGNYFSEEELKYFWENKNLSMYLEKGPSYSGNTLPTNISFALLENFIETSEKAIKNREIAANLRFAHAETIIPFASLLKIDFASKQTNNFNEVQDIWKDYIVSPMGANIQWIFYSNNEDILVKMLYNEKEIEFPIESSLKPYYKWNEIKKFYENILDSIHFSKDISIEEAVKIYKN